MQEKVSYDTTEIVFFIQVGLGGVGRRSCIQLAAYIANMKYHCLTPLHSQTPFVDCVEEIKTVLRQCGLLNQPTVLLATDTAAGEHQVHCTL